MRVFSYMPEDRDLPQALNHVPSEVVDPLEVSIYRDGRFVCGIFPSQGAGEIHMPHATLTTYEGAPGYYVAHYGRRPEHVL